MDKTQEEYIYQGMKSVAEKAAKDLEDTNRKIRGIKIRQIASLIASVMIIMILVGIFKVAIDIRDGDLYTIQTLTKLLRTVNQTP